ncbi:MAG: hypothetical protein ACOYMU_03225 [Phycisphaerales bacterium]
MSTTQSSLLSQSVENSTAAELADAISVGSAPRIRPSTSGSTSRGSTSRPVIRDIDEELCNFGNELAIDLKSKFRPQIRLRSSVGSKTV